jgi:hypothetical protein
MGRLGTERPLGSLGTRDQTISVSVDGRGCAGRGCASTTVLHNNKLFTRRPSPESTDSSKKMGGLGTERPLASRGTRDQIGTKQFLCPNYLTSFQAASTADTDVSYIAKYAVLREIQAMALLSHADIGYIYM